jgi:hypothetical protein
MFLIVPFRHDDGFVPSQQIGSRFRFAQLLLRDGDGLIEFY